ncbi:MAG: hypothetical protein SGPRY_010308, partial [Prymnesium sp.]
DDDGLPAKAVRPREEDLKLGDASELQDEDTNEAEVLASSPSHETKPPSLAVGSEVVLLRLDKMQFFNGKASLLSLPPPEPPRPFSHLGIGWRRRPLLPKPKKRQCDVQELSLKPVACGCRLVLKPENVMPCELDHHSTHIALDVQPQAEGHGCGPLPSDLPDDWESPLSPEELSDDEPTTADLDDFTMRRGGGVSCDRWHEDDFVPPPRKMRVWGSDEEGGGSQCGSEAVETDSERQDETDDGEASGEETWSDVAADQSSGKHLFALTMDS